MEALDVVKNIGPCLTSILILLSVYALALEHAEEAFGSGVIGAGPNSTHRTGQVVAF